MRAMTAVGVPPDAAWAVPVANTAAALGSGPTGLTAEQATRRLGEVGRNVLAPERRWSSARLLLDQLRSPLVLILVFAAVVAFVAGAYSDSAVVLAIIVVSAGIGFIREREAHGAIARLRDRLITEARVIRDGIEVRIPVTEVVPGDVVALAAGALIPADAVVWEATDLYVNEAILTGEAFPTEKRPGLCGVETPLAGRANCVFLGSSVRSGTARVLVVATGATTAYGHIAARLRLRPPETEFDRGVRQFGIFLTSAMSALVIAVFAVNVVFGRPVVDALLFSIALAVGLSPELLPAILSVNLAHGARSLAAHGVLVRRLAAIENLGSMDVLCTDKTGTLTEGVVGVAGAYDVDGRPDVRVLALAVLNARLQTGLVNPIDQALAQQAAPAPDGAVAVKLAEVPYDFTRRRLSVVVAASAGARLIAKGAVEPLLAVCTHVAGGRPLDDRLRADIAERFRTWSDEGLRVLGVATRSLAVQARYSRDDERDMQFEGFIAFADPPKAGAEAALSDLRKLGVTVKIITGDNRLVAAHVARAVGVDARAALTGEAIDRLNDEALWSLAEKTAVFSEVDPHQKERLIGALRKMGHVVGFMGDGINDAPAMHAADTSISVEGAADVARATADFVLLERNLDVLRRGIVEGRTTFANTLKYVQTTVSANLGNMISMAAASLFLPFLPLLAGQILLNNFLSDVPAFGLAQDSVDEELLAQPRRWNLPQLRRFMIKFGLLSSLFDFATFAVLLLLYRAEAAQFRTAWFVESLLTELAIALVLRTKRPFFRSRPGRFLLWSTVGVAAGTIALPYLPGARSLGFVSLPPTLVVLIFFIAAAYMAAAELLKRGVNASELRRETQHG